MRQKPILWSVTLACGLFVSSGLLGSCGTETADDDVQCREEVLSTETETVSEQSPLELLCCSGGAGCPVSEWPYHRCRLDGDTHRGCCLRLTGCSRCYLR